MTAQHVELRGAIQEDFGKFASVSISKIVEAAARVRDMTGVENDEVFEEEIRQLCELEVEARACQDIVQKRYTEYLQTPDLGTRVNSNMSENLDKEMEEAYQRAPLRGNHERTTTWAKWCDELGLAAPDDPDDDLQVSGAVFKNTRCIFTQKSIFELDNPVEDAHHYIHERAAIVQLVQNNGGKSAPHPEKQGVRITVQELVPCRRVQREAERRRKEAESQAANMQEIL